MCASNKACFYLCYCCYWATAKSTWTYLTYEKKKKEREEKEIDSQTQSAGERRKQMIGCDLTGNEAEREETMRDREEQRQEKQATTKGVLSQCEEQLENKER